MAVITVVELIWWALAWREGIAPAPFVFSYLALASAALAAASALRRALRLGPSSVPWRSLLVATLLVAVGASAFLPLKYAIPHEMPFWLDRPLAQAERAWLGADPWLLIDRLLGWAAIPMDWIYACWLPVQSLILFSVILARPSTLKSRALVAYSLAWFLLGAVAAMLLSSAGPLFYDRLYGETRFTPLTYALRAHGVWIALKESHLMYAATASNHPGLVAGISAMPSIHVAISLWIYLTARALVPRTARIAFIYFLLVWVGSVQLGWHYASDGLAGAIGMLGVWRVSHMFVPSAQTISPSRVPRLVVQSE